MEMGDLHGVLRLPEPGAPGAPGLFEWERVKVRSTLGATGVYFTSETCPHVSYNTHGVSFRRCLSMRAMGCCSATRGALVCSTGFCFTAT